MVEKVYAFRTKSGRKESVSYLDEERVKQLLMRIGFDEEEAREQLKNLDDMDKSLTVKIQKIQRVK